MTADPAEPVVETARRMAELDVGDVIVVEERDSGAYPIGMLTDRDLVVRGLARGNARVGEMRVADLMRTDLITAREDEDVDVVLEKLRRHTIRRMPIVDEAGRLQGILTLDDIVAWIGAELNDTSDLLDRQGRGAVETAPPRPEPEPPPAPSRQRVPATVREPHRELGRAFVGGLVAGLIGGGLLGALVAAIGAPLTANLWIPVLGVSAAWGALFGLLAYGLSRPVTLLVGVMFGLVLGALLLFVVLPGVAGVDVRSEVPIGTALGLHAAFGFVIALAFLLFQHRGVDLTAARSSSP